MDLERNALQTPPAGPQETLTLGELPVEDAFPGEAELETDPSKPDVNSFRRAFRALAWYRQVVATADEDEKKLLAKIDQETANVKDFYARKRAGADARIAVWKDQLHRMMTILGVKKFATPYGTSFYKPGKKKTWLKEDEDLVAWANTTEHAEDLIRKKEYPDKKAIEAYVESTGAEGIIQVTEKEEVQVRLKDAE
jgi:hypothetical protein